MTHIDVITKDDLWRENIDGYFPFLMEIYNPDIAWSDNDKERYGQDNGYLRVICDDNRVTYNGKVYLPSSFTFAMPESDGTKIGNSSLNISALDYRIRKMLGTIRCPCEVKVVALFAKVKKQGDKEEGGYIFKYKKMESFLFKMEMADCNKITAKFTLLSQHAAQGDCPYDVATQDRVPATKG